MRVASAATESRGRFVTSRGRDLYEIANVDAMAPFLMTCVCDSDLWMFVSSRGTFTAGRVEEDRCLFAYETDDRLHERSGITGPVTRIRFPDGRVWWPIGARRSTGGPRTLRRSSVGDRVEFEEEDEQSGLVFRVEYALSDQFGIIRSCELRGSGSASPVSCELIDGYLQVMPAGVPLGLQQTMSTLVDAYKRSEFAYPEGPALFALESAISDRPEAVESLRANVVWRTGLDGAMESVSEESLHAFEEGRSPVERRRMLGERGAYLNRTTLRILPGESIRWRVIADVHLDHAAICDLNRRLRLESAVDEQIDESLERGRTQLARLLDAADGAQVTGNRSACAAHRSNVLFNAMRGGVPVDEYAVDPDVFRKFVMDRHASIGARHEAFLAGVESRLTVDALPGAAEGTDDPQLTRLAYEFLPLTFSRRHGDPSRPWNRFRIPSYGAEGRRDIAYEGNWRDIFQNWEALCLSYPALLPNVIAKFANASTLDGHNPYRINERGVDWEIPEPDHAWAAFGYWGDHQIVYLLRLLELSRHTLPEWLPSVLEQRIFSYSNVPYRIRPFDDVARDPRSTIDFDDSIERLVESRVAEVGHDGRLVWDDRGEPVLVTLIEKLLVPALAKISNLVPGGGVWMNTQRPEWNDANNALAGFGLSMVTLYHLRRYCDVVGELLSSAESNDFMLSPAVGQWCIDAVAAMTRVLEEFETLGLEDDDARRRAIAILGSAADTARATLYEHGPGTAEPCSAATVLQFFRLGRRLCDHSIQSARRSDGLYESYNILHLESSRASVAQLNAMLEGQVAILSSAVLGPVETIQLLRALFESVLYRPDQRTFTLYPPVELPAFMRRNVVPRETVKASRLLQEALKSPEIGLVLRDARGEARFHADLVSHAALERRLEGLAASPDWTDLVREDASTVREAFEETFGHARFTGRSGRMHKYEGLGSVYWHMVSKLWLAVQESIFRFSGEEPALIAELVTFCRRIRDGLGFCKTPAEFGAVPHEPYSHTPLGRGAQQPGMTGQVKEGIIARLGDLGVWPRQGRLVFNPLLIDPKEFVEEPRVLTLSGHPDREVVIPSGAIGLTVCGVPVIVRRSDTNRLILRIHDGSSIEVADASLPMEWTRRVYLRTGEVNLIEAEVSASSSSSTLLSAHRSPDIRSVEPLNGQE